LKTRSEECRIEVKSEIKNQGLAGGQKEFRILMNNIGRKITDNYCNGYFGNTRISLQCKNSIIVGEGYEWVVIKTETGKVYFTDFPSGNKQELIDSWCA
jgi:hypothetical protein